MIYEYEAPLLNRFLRDVSPHARISDTEYSEEQIKKRIDELSFDESKLPRGWKQFFTSRTKNIVESGVETGETEELYRLAPSTIISEWAEEIDNRPWFAETQLEQVDEVSWRLTVESDGFGILSFRVFFDGKRAEAYSPDILKGKFAVWFVRPQTNSKNGDKFKWKKFLNDDFWESLRQRLNRTQSPLTRDLCRNDSVAADDNMDGVERCIRQTINNLDATVKEQPREEVPSIEEYLDGPILFGAKEDDSSYLVVCECDLSPNHIHLHFFRDGMPSYLSDSVHADDISETVSKKVERYNSLSADKEDATKVLRPAAIIISGMTAVQIIPFFTFFGLNPNTQTVKIIVAIWVIVAAVVTIGILAYLLSPIIAFRDFGWEDV